MGNNIEQGIYPSKVAQAVKRHQLMAEGDRARIDPTNDTTKNCPSSYSLRALVRETLTHRRAAEAIKKEWMLEKQLNY